MTEGILAARIGETVVPGRRLGWHVEQDPRSRDYPVRARLAGPSPLTSRRWERRTPPMDQGNLGACTGYAMEGALATAPLRRTLGRYGSRSAVRLYRLATSIDEFDGAYPPDDTGSSTLGICKAAVLDGKVSRYEWCFGIEDVLDALSRVGPVVCGILWMEGCDDPDERGVVSIDGDVRGGHEIELDEIDVGLLNPLDSLVGFTNSWGSGWGQRGRAYFRARDLASLLDRRGDAAIPIR